MSGLSYINLAALIIESSISDKTGQYRYRVVCICNTCMLSACDAEHVSLPDAQTLITGTALTEHMEEFYLDTLRALATAEASITGIANELEDSKAGEY